MSITHKFINLIPDDTDPGITKPSHWNDEHDYNLETITEDIDFIGSDEEDITISIQAISKEVVRGRLWIDVDPEIAFSQWASLTFYNKSQMKGEDAFFRIDCKLVYTELAVATTGSDTIIIPDDYTDLNPSDLIIFLDDNEKSRLETIASTMIAEDIIGVHAIDTGISRIIELAGFTLFNNEAGTDIYCKIKFGSAQTVSLKFEMVLR